MDSSLYQVYLHKSEHNEFELPTITPPALHIYNTGYNVDLIAALSFCLQILELKWKWGMQNDSVFMVFIFLTKGVNKINGDIWKWNSLVPVKVNIAACEIVSQWYLFICKIRLKIFLVYNFI